MESTRTLGKDVAGGHSAREKVIVSSKRRRAEQERSVESEEEDEQVREKTPEQDDPLWLQQKAIVEIADRIARIERKTGQRRGSTSEW